MRLFRFTDAARENWLICGEEGWGFGSVKRPELHAEAFVVAGEVNAVTFQAMKASEGMHLFYVEAGTEGSLPYHDEQATLHPPIMLLAGLDWTTPLVAQGQIVVVSYAWYDTSLYRRMLDQSDGRTGYAALDQEAADELDLAGEPDFDGPLWDAFRDHPPVTDDLWSVVLPSQEDKIRERATAAFDKVMDEGGNIGQAVDACNAVCAEAGIPGMQIVDDKPEARHNSN